MRDVAAVARLVRRLAIPAELLGFEAEVPVAGESERRGEEQGVGAMRRRDFVATADP